MLFSLLNVPSASASTAAGSGGAGAPGARRRSRSCRCPCGGPRAQAPPTCPTRRGCPGPLRDGCGPLHRRRGADLPVSAGQRRAGHGRDRLPEFLFGTTWRPANDLYGIFPMIVGSLYVTAGAMIVGVPGGLLTALYLSRFARGRTGLLPAQRRGAAGRHSIGGLRLLRAGHHRALRASARAGHRGFRCWQPA